MPTSESNPTLTPSSIPKQYGGVRQTRHANTTLVEPMVALEVVDVSNTSSDEEEVETMQEHAHVL